MTESVRPPGRHPGWPARLGPLRVRAGTVALRPVRMRDATAWSAIRLRDEAYLSPWEPTEPTSWPQRNGSFDWLARCSGLRGMARRGSALPFAVTLDGAFVGQVVVGNVVREPLLSGYLGYWVGSHIAGGGVTTAAVGLIVDHCFGPVGLHRVEATVRPENAASLRVLAKLGFREEGLLRRYLDVQGAWRDHLAFALTVDEVPEGMVTRLLRAGWATHP